MIKVAHDAVTLVCVCAVTSVCVCVCVCVCVLCCDLGVCAAGARGVNEGMELSV